MKAFNICLIIMISLSSLTLTACDPFKGLRGYGQEAGANGRSNWGLKNARGDRVGTCKSGYPVSSAGYLEDYNLPREIGGNFICDGDTPKLPKDCQGREFRSEAELRVYWEKYQLPVGYVWWECHNGIPKVAPSSIKGWSQMESVNPTCKDSRGRKRPCV